ncbi:proprotein convertase subtilisin/kexin type 5 [Periophthalmus magnuspinnatus]|uniref:proprotein convertase subtilisin/kexin type 5 n=1 Tax=Periophthalmus magnuspinnatus TaxID=409849 RepID=UPI002437037E|nr:proprotein convertase subtilisin/kexin type 5 [Periophthalmus magnuspinnatus]
MSSERCDASGEALNAAEESLQRTVKGQIFTNEWAIKIIGDQRIVSEIAEKYGFSNMGQVGELTSYYSFWHNETAKRSSMSNDGLTFIVSKEAEVEWLQQQIVQKRVNRVSGVRQIYSTKHFSAFHLPSNQTTPLQFDNPKWSSLWFIRCSDRATGCRSHMNIAGAWKRGYTGKGVVVSVVDDGIEGAHLDLKSNYDPLASFDPNRPKQTNHISMNHGTQCAGIVAAANSSHCTVGVSFRARIGGINMLSGDVTDVVEAQSLSFKPHYIDIYLCTWGPEDDGVTVGGPGPLAKMALEYGIKTGRQGRGSIFVWASGNGGHSGDHCSCDGYSNSIYTVSISPTLWSGARPGFHERCPSTLATAYSGGEGKPMMTAGDHQTCVKARPSSSLSASVAAGVIALTLEANPLLTWRDIQHIIVRTSKTEHLEAPDWTINGAGYRVSHLYGFGLMDAEDMVKEAERWKQVPSQHMCVEEAPVQKIRTIYPGSVVTSVYETAGCAGNPLQHVAYVEHVIVRVTITHSHRGSLFIRLLSPSGTVSELLAHRPLDNSSEGFQNWEFMTTHSWGEPATGKWTLKINISSKSHNIAELGALIKWSLVIYGTAERPYVPQKSVRSAEPVDNDVLEEYNGPCDAECTSDGCEGPGPQQCVACLHLFLKFKNGTRLCVSECPKGLWGDRRRCKRCYATCESCTGSRSDQCTTCQSGHHLTEGTNTCTTICGEGYYLDHDSNMCRKCSDNCLKCTTFSICTECKEDTSLQGNQCLRSCPAGFYHDKQESICKPCHKACATCAGPGVESCKRCAEGYLMEEWRCVHSCSAGFYATEPNPEITYGQRICRRCDASCSACAGPGPENCSRCSSGHSHQGGVCVLNTECEEGEYPDSTGKCHACDATCLKCTGPQSSDCISCDFSRSLDEGHCVLDCAKGKYESGGQCHLCDHTCASCSDTGSNCTSCDTDKFGMDRYLFMSQCVDVCPESFYHTKEKSCDPCSDHCRLCSSPTHCLKCNSSYYVSDGLCNKLECGEGEVEDPDYEDCMACEEGCKKCVLYNPRHCLSCIEGFYNFQDGCFKNCPAKTYSVEEEMTCIPCDEKCVSCDEHECYWCETDLFLSEGTCVEVCPDGFYGDEDSNDCEECHSDCVSCSGPEEDDCTSCEEGKTLENGLCVFEHEACPVKTYRSDDGACEDCHSSCEACSGDAKNQCTKCAKGRFLSPQQTCVLKCPGGYFANRLTSVCEECPFGCLTCMDAQHCTRCKTTHSAPLYLQNGHCVEQCVRGYPAGLVCRSCETGCASCVTNSTHCLSCDAPLLLHKHLCVEDCPAGHAVRDGECHRCPPACAECNPLGQCIECEEYNFLHEGLCVEDCPERFFDDTEQRECSRCHSDCRLCDGPNNNDCDSCVDPQATLHNGACLTSCPSHTYRDDISGDCKDCDASCLTCSGPYSDSCTSCRDGHRLEGHGHCAPMTHSKCTVHQYVDHSGECHQCHKYCHRCSGPDTNHCLTCNQGHLLLNGTCLDRCPVGYYQDEMGIKCEPCHPSCESCVGKHSHECLSCKSSLFRESKECVETCQHGHYGNLASMMCERCDPSCGECLGAGEDGCLSCTAGLLYLRKAGRCLPVCPEGYYHDAVHGTCELCHPTCKACSAKESHSCQSCHAGYRLSDGVCESMCYRGQYPVIEALELACEDCDASCLECWGQGPTSCTSCPPQAMLEPGGRCLLCCSHDDEDGADNKGQQDCCNCTESRGECVLSTNLPFKNDEGEEERGNLAVFITACILLVIVLVAIVFLIRHSRSKGAARDTPIRGYEKLGSGGFGGGSGRHGYSPASSASYSGHAGHSSSGRFQESQMVDFSDRRLGSKNDDDDDDEDIVYMGQDGTVYRKFKYGQLGDDNDDELEYDDESYTFR